MIYLDSCALIKLVRAEPGAESLAHWLEARSQTPWFSSGLVRVELFRALQRLEASEEDYREASALLNELNTKPVDTVLEDAARLQGRHLRSSDAIHLATARAAGTALTAFVTYDQRLARTAKESNLPVQQPS